MGKSEQAAQRAVDGLRRAGVPAELGTGPELGLSVDGDPLVVSLTGHGVRVKVPSMGTFIVTAEPSAADELRGLIWAARRFRTRERKRQGIDRFEKLFERTAAFFSNAGVSLQVSSSVKVAGERLGPALTHDGQPVAVRRGTKHGRLFLVVNPESAAPFRAVKNDSDGLCRALARGRFQSQALLAARRNLPADGADISVDHAGRITVVRRGKAVCVIDGIEATVPGEPVIRGNFLAEGRHWDKLAQARRRRARRILDSQPLDTEADPEVETEVETEALPPPDPAAPVTDVPAPVLVIRQPPADLPSAIASEAIEASTRIRTQRQTAYHFTAHLHVSTGEQIAFLPIDPSPRLRVPFIYTGRTSLDVHGEIRLRGEIDPLPLAITGDAPEARVIGRIWLLALLGFAALTCPEPVQASSGHRRAPPSVRGGYRPDAARRSARTRHWSAELQIRGHRGQAIPHLVVAHRRKLTGGRTASPAAIRAAGQVGITLEDHETWVRGHARGAATLTEAHFDWRISEAHRQLLGRLPAT